MAGFPLAFDEKWSNFPVIKFQKGALELFSSTRFTKHHFSFWFSVQLSYLRWKYSDFAFQVSNVTAYLNLIYFSCIFLLKDVESLKNLNFSRFLYSLWYHKWWNQVENMGNRSWSRHWCVSRARHDIEVCPSVRLSPSSVEQIIKYYVLRVFL